MIFYVDKIIKRDFFLNATELIIAPFESSPVYCLMYNPEILGAIQRRKVIAAKRFVDDELSFYKNLFLLSSKLSFPKKFENLVQISSGMSPCFTHTKFYYFLPPFWEQKKYQNYQLKMTWFERLMARWFIKRVIKSLKQNAPSVFCSSKELAARYGLMENQVIYPFFQSEDYPPMEVLCDKQSITILLDGASKDEELALIKYLSQLSNEHNVFIFASQSELAEEYKKLGSNIRFEEKFCSSTLQAAYVQSKLAFFFDHDDIFPKVLGALASGVTVGHLPSSIVSEVIPKTLRQEFQSLNSALDYLIKKNANEHAIFSRENAADMRRFALRFNEKNFKTQVLKAINGYK